MVERKIGEVFELNGHKMKVVSQINDCSECDLYDKATYGDSCCDFMDICSITGECMGFLRSDKTDVVFKYINNNGYDRA